jgi:hypothetical protein
MNIVRDYSAKVAPRDEARIRSAWQAEIERLETDDEIREWFRRTWIVIGRLVGEHRRALRLRKKGTPDVGDPRVDLRDASAQPRNASVVPSNASLGVTSPLGNAYEAVQRRCIACGTAFKGKRKDAQHCSAACRQRAHRSRHGAPEARP